MTISSETFKMIYTCDGSTTVFPYTFKIFEDGDLEVILYTIADGTETTLTLTTHYTISGAGDASGGNVTTVASYANTYKIIIRRSLDLTQETDYVANDPFAAETHEDALDKLTMIVQQQQEALDRTILQDASATSSVDFPAPVADKLIGWDAAGSELTNITNPENEAEEHADDAEASAIAAAASAAAAAASANAASGNQETFTNADLSSGILTITHNLGLTTPYALDITVVDNNSIIIAPDEITSGENSFTVDLSAYGTITGTWAVLYGGSPASSITTDSIEDDDGDTKIQVEESADEDKIRFDTAGTQRGYFDANGLTLESGASINEFSTDDALSGDSDVAVPTEQAVKAYVDGQVSVLQTGVSKSENTIYQAAEDGILTVNVHFDASAASVYAVDLKTGTTSPPASSVAVIRRKNSDDDFAREVMCYPIKKDLYYEVETSGTTGSIDSIEFHALRS